MMASVSRPLPPPCFRCENRFIPLSSSTLIPPISFRGYALFRVRALKTRSEGSKISSSVSPGLLRRPSAEEEIEAGEISVNEQVELGNGIYRGRETKEWVDWEDQILEDTVPLVGFVRMILHSGKYEDWERLIPEHEATIIERLLPYHPEFKKKIGCGIDYITVGNHPDFAGSRCMFIVRKDGELIDFSYWKCIKGLIRKNYPLYADSFILRHFRKRRQDR